VLPRRVRDEAPSIGNQSLVRSGRLELAHDFGIDFCDDLDRFSPPERVEFKQSRNDYFSWF